MATKAQLMAELDALKQQMASRDDPAPTTPDETEQTDENPDSDPLSSLSCMFTSHGIAAADLDALWSKFSNEVNELSHDKPLLTAAAAFGLGFALGRMSK